MAACGRLSETEMTETWCAVNSTGRISGLRARCIPSKVTAREVVLTAWYGYRCTLLSSAKCCHQDELHAEPGVARLRVRMVRNTV